MANQSKLVRLGLVVVLLAGGGFAYQKATQPKAGTKSVTFAARRGTTFATRCCTTFASRRRTTFAARR